MAGDQRQLADIPARIASSLAQYREWITRSGLSSGTMRADVLVALDETLVSALSRLETPADQVHENIRDFWPG